MCFKIGAKVKNILNDETGTVVPFEIGLRNPYPLHEGWRGAQIARKYDNDTYIVIWTYVWQAVYFDARKETIQVPLFLLETA